LAIQRRADLLAESKARGKAGRAFARVGRLQRLGLWSFVEEGWVCHLCGRGFTWGKASLFSPSWVLRHFDAAHGSEAHPRHARPS
jgi:hypothetical protein